MGPRVRGDDTVLSQRPQLAAQHLAGGGHFYAYGGVPVAPAMVIQAYLFRVLRDSHDPNAPRAGHQILFFRRDGMETEWKVS